MGFQTGFLNNWVFEGNDHTAGANLVEVEISLKQSAPIARSEKRLGMERLDRRLGHSAQLQSFGGGADSRGTKAKNSGLGLKRRADSLLKKPSRLRTTKKSEKPKDSTT